jgi:hypothetical protein
MIKSNLYCVATAFLEAQDKIKEFDVIAFIGVTIFSCTIPCQQKHPCLIEPQ